MNCPYTARNYQPMCSFGCCYRCICGSGWGSSHNVSQPISNSTKNMETNKKVEYIKEQLKSFIQVPTSIYETSEMYNVTKQHLQFASVAVVDIDKLANFLEKYLKISADELLS